MFMCSKADIGVECVDLKLSNAFYSLGKFTWHKYIFLTFSLYAAMSWKRCTSWHSLRQPNLFLSSSWFPQNTHPLCPFTAWIFSSTLLLTCFYNIFPVISDPFPISEPLGCLLRLPIHISSSLPFPVPRVWLFKLQLCFVVQVLWFLNKNKH